MMKTLMLTLFFLTTALTAVEYHIDKDQQNQVKFISDAPVEQIVGVTDKIDGYIMWEGDNLLSQSAFYFEVDLASMDTGIGLRNRHMRENYLETDKFQFASFEGKIVEAVDNGDNTFNVTTVGIFKLHGVEKNIEIDGVVSRTTDGYKAASQFEIKLEDYKIERPQLMLLKISTVIQLDVQFYTKEFKQ